VDPGTHEVAMYEDYAARYSIVVAYIPPDFDKNGSTRLRINTSGYNGGPTVDTVAERTNVGRTDPSDIYFAHYHQVFPIRVSEQPVTAEGGAGPLKLSVTFKYNRWTDPVLDYENKRRFIRQQIQDIQKFNINEKDVMQDMVSSRQRELARRTMDGLDVMRSGVRREDQTFRGPAPIDDPNTQIGLVEEQLSPFDKFKKIARDVARYSNPQELKGLLINQGLGRINEVLGEGVVETIAQGGQIVDVYRRTQNKDIQNTSNKLIGPLGNLIR
jgi:hypothetical protein